MVRRRRVGQKAHPPLDEVPRYSDRLLQQATLTPQQLKKSLVEAGFEVFRTTADEVVLADRVRENLILDSGVRLGAGEPLQVRVIMRAQQADFPGDDEGGLFARVRELAQAAVSNGFTEQSTAVTPILDPADRERTLDTFYEIAFVRQAGAIDDAVALLRFAMALEKTAENPK